MPQLPQHPFERQSRTLAVATHDQVFGGHLDDQQLVFRQVWPAMGMGSTDNNTDYRILVDGKSLRPSKDVFYFKQLTLFGDQ